MISALGIDSGRITGHSEIRARARSGRETPISVAALLERFFTQRLTQQRQASPHTISSYRDTFRQFLKFTAQRLHRVPSQLDFQEIDASLIMAFLDHLEKASGGQHSQP